MGVPVSLWDYASSSLGCVSRSRIAASYGNSMLNFWVTAIPFSKAATPTHIPTSSAQAFQFLHVLTYTCCFMCFLLYYGQPNDCEVCLLMAWICMSLMMSDIEPLVICISSVGKLSSCFISKNKTYWHLKMVLSWISTEQTAIRIQIPDWPDHLTEWNIADVAGKVDWLRSRQPLSESAPLACAPPRKAPHDVSTLWRTGK